MRKLHNKGLINKLIMCIITAILLCNFAVPNYTYAKTDPEEGGLLLKALDQFVAFLGDKVMEWLQNTFTTEAPIENIDGTYNFQYSPAIIFSGAVKAMDINFISPNDNLPELPETQHFDEATIRENLDWINDNAVSYDFPEGESISTLEEQLINTEHYNYFMEYGSMETTYHVFWKENRLIVYISKGVVGPGYHSTSYKKYDSSQGTGNYESTAEKLQATIASWYKALRRIALVGLLSVLVYIGIKIVLSSSSPQDQSKYKKMLTDWLVAICLLFTLHYIMSLTLTVTQGITKIFNVGESDELLNTLRANIKSGGSWGVVTGEVIMYATLVILTITYTIQYLKRVIYMAFFTMIAPLIALTYPLDKIKDGQAQAFNMWIREYVFNALIQIVHLVIYIVLVSSAMALVKHYTLYAIVALLFIKKAEGIIKKMFGFDKAETVGAIGAATTGALVMNAVNSLRRPPKGAKGGASGGGEGGSTKGVRTAEKDPLEGLRTARTRSQGGNGAEGEGSSTQAARNSEEATRRISSAAAEESERTNRVAANKTEKDKKETLHLAKGMWALTKKYTGPALSKLGGLALGGAGGLIGFSAGVAQGDIGKALTGAVAGGAAGYHGGQRLVNSGINALDSIGNIKDKVQNIEDTFNEGARGKDYVQNARYDREFFKSEGYKKLMEENPNTAQDDIETMLEAGITDTKSMGKILKNSNGNLEEEIGYYALSKDCDNGVFYGDKGKLGEYLAAKLKVDSIDEQTIDNFYNRMKKYR